MMRARERSGPHTQEQVDHRPVQEWCDKIKGKAQNDSSNSLQEDVAVCAARWYKSIRKLNELCTNEINTYYDKSWLLFFCNIIPLLKAKKSSYLKLKYNDLTNKKITASLFSLHWNNRETHFFYYYCQYSTLKSNPVMIDAHNPLYLPRCHLSAVIQRVRQYVALKPEPMNRL